MKKAIAIVAAMAALVGMNMTANAEIYPHCGIITQIGEEAIVITDFDGETWVWEGYPEDLEIGDVMAMIVDDMETPYIYDDEILGIRYCGFFDENWSGGYAIDPEWDAQVNWE